jgi:ferredoxin
MAEIFWNSWFNETAKESIDYLFDEILLKHESAFPDQIIVPDFKDNEKIVIASHIHPSITIQENRMLMDIVTRIISIIPKNCQIKILLDVQNQAIASIWKNYYTECKLMSEEIYIELKKPNKEYSPFSTVQPKKEYLTNWYIPFELDQASQIIPIVPIQPSPIFQVSGVISSFFWFLPTKIKNEILIQKTNENRTNAFMEILASLFPKITLSGLLYQGTKNFAVFGNDPISVDAFASALMSIKASSVLTTKYCKKHKLGMGDLIKIHVQGERFKKPVVNERQTYKQKYDLYFDPNLCTFCKQCIDLCPFQVIFSKEKQLYYSKKQCNQCGFCVSLCPVQAVREV